MRVDRNKKFIKCSMQVSLLLSKCIHQVHSVRLKIRSFSCQWQQVCLTNEINDYLVTQILIAHKLSNSVRLCPRESTLWMHTFAGGVMFLHTNMPPKWHIDIATDWSKYIRRWQTLQGSKRHWLEICERFLGCAHSVITGVMTSPDVISIDGKPLNMSGVTMRHRDIMYRRTGNYWISQYWIITIWIFISQLVDNIRPKNTRAGRYYLQELNCCFKFSFGPPVDRWDRAPVDTRFFAQSDSMFRSPTVDASTLLGNVGAVWCSASFLAKISVRSPQKLVIFRIWKKVTILILKTEALVWCLAMCEVPLLIILIHWRRVLFITLLESVHISAYYSPRLAKMSGTILLASALC